MCTHSIAPNLSETATRLLANPRPISEVSYSEKGDSGSGMRSCLILDDAVWVLARMRRSHKYCGNSRTLLTFNSQRPFDTSIRQSQMLKLVLEAGCGFRETD
jgi:hypothetical protein